MTISREECQTAYLEILANSNQKWQEGLILGEAGNYGTAISLSIISIEELVKSLVVVLDGKGFEFRNVNGIVTIFKNHQIRYLIAYAMFAMGIFGEELMKFILKIKKDPESLFSLVEEMKNDESYFERNYKFYLFKKMITLKREFAWFSKADLFRQDGFYCDYDEQIKSPIYIDKKEYQHAMKRLEKVRTVGIGLIETIDNPESATEILNKLKTDFKTKNYYDHIGEALAKVRRAKSNPFELISRSVDRTKNARIS